jgi:small-conductance mechanosensitive channel
MISRRLLSAVLLAMPLQQSTVLRELLRRIKNRFDEPGIEIPTPQLTVHRSDRETVGMADQPRKRRAD